MDADILNKRDRNKRRREWQKEKKEKMEKSKKLKSTNASDYDAKVIINSEASAGASGHRVKQIPFPFKSVPEFEAGILAHPIGRTFVPETAFRVLTREKVSTKMGTMIPPMAEDNIRKRKKKEKGGKEKKNSKK